jgi:hypothetical protein
MFFRNISVWSKIKIHHFSSAAKKSRSKTGLSFNKIQADSSRRILAKNAMGFAEQIGE